MNELAAEELFALRGANKFICQVFIRETEGTTQGVFDQVFSEAVCEVFFAFSDEVASFVVVVGSWSFVKCSRGVHCPGFAFADASASPVSRLVVVFSPPLSGGVEVFQAEANGVDLAMTTCALRFFLMSEESFTRCKDLTFKTRYLRDVGR